MKKVSKYIVTIISILFFALAMYIIVFGSIARRNNDLLTFFGYSYANVPTNSMAGDNEDSFDAGSMIITKSKKYEDIVVGDIIVFSEGDILIVHRVIEINTKGLVTKGDNNNVADLNPVTKENYKGVVVKSFNFFNFGTKISSHQLQIIGLMILGLAIYLIYQVVVIIKMIFKHRADNIRREHEEELKLEIIKEMKDINYERKFESSN